MVDLERDDQFNNLVAKLDINKFLEPLKHKLLMISMKIFLRGYIIFLQKILKKQEECFCISKFWEMTNTPQLIRTLCSYKRMWIECPIF